ncbi:RNA-dependent RNA polymerase [Colletotrichum eremochloae totivirus 1]|nr:RNA-dependent RNA polymerase [Colletotrichum eremochloae totivirus 1]
MHDLDARAEEFGPLGRELLALLQEHDGIIEAYAAGDFTQRLVKLHGAVGTLKHRDPLLPYAVSLLCLDYPMQAPIDSSTITRLLRLAYDYSFLYDDKIEIIQKTCEKLKHKNSHTHAPGDTCSAHNLPASWPKNDRQFARLLGHHVTNTRCFRRELFPRKQHSAAGVKVNIRLGPLASAISRTHSTTDLGLILRPLVGLANDVVCGALLYAYSLEPTFNVFGRSIACAAVLQPQAAKGLSNALKALGANSSMPGCMLVEAVGLQGRDVGTVDMNDEVRRRCDPELVKGLVISNADELRPHVRAILDLELAKRSPLPDVDDFWSSRWLWCVNGAQNRKSDEALGLHPPLGGRRYRRMAAEEKYDNPIPNWDGTTSVSASIKLETGKNRAIFACDTRSYFAFSHILNSAQRDWAGHRVILNPGLGGLAGVARRVRNAQGHGGVNVMLDYDDFNSHHATDVQQMIFEELAILYDLPSSERTALVSSFEKMYISHGGREFHVKGTLMSGHRGTSFINSVLNAAYIRCAVGGPTFDRMVSLHAGDDVYIRARTLSEAATLLEDCKRFGCRMNPTKQSIGFTHAEFLRLGIGKYSAHGYLARSLSTLVAGSWVDLDPMKPEEGLVSAITSTRSAINRGAPLSIARLIARSYSSISGYKLADLDKLLLGSWSLEGAPVYNTDYWIRNFRVQRPPPPHPPDADAALSQGRGSYATRAYLEHHVTPVEAEAARLAQADYTALMLGSSYAKGVTPQDLPVNSPVCPRLVPLSPRRATGFVDVPSLLSRNESKGLLAGYPLLRLIESRLTDDDIKTLFSSLGLDHNVRDIRAAAFGFEGHSCNVIGTLPYADAGSYSRRTTADNIVVSYPICS